MNESIDPKLVELARNARAFLESNWMDFLCDEWSSVSIPLSTGACRVSSEFLAAIMPEHGFEGWSVHGGPDAFTAADGTTHDHYWVSNGIHIIDITADQFDLDPIVVGPADEARYRVGPSMPLSEGALSETGCVDCWIEEWRLTDGTPRPSSMSSDALVRYAGPEAAALAILLHELTGLPIHLSTMGHPPHPVVMDGDHTFDAHGLIQSSWMVMAFGHGLEGFAPTDPDGLRAALGPVSPEAVEAAYGFAMAHPALRQAIQQAFYVRRDAENASQDAENASQDAEPDQPWVFDEVEEWDEPARPSM